MKYYLLFAMPLLFAVQSCKKDDKQSKEPMLIFKFKFDDNQDRYDSFGQLTNTLPAGHAAQHPKFNSMAAHYIELTQNMFTAVGKGVVLYHAPEVTQGSKTGIDHNKSVLAGNNEMFFKIPLKDVAKGEYEYLRISVAYQNYTVKLHYDTSFVSSGLTITADEDLDATVASFIGYNTYITNFKIADATVSVNDFKKQGYWGGRQNTNIPFKSGGVVVYNYPLNYTVTGQNPEGATTVPNPLFATSPIPDGSCLVTGTFDKGKLQITGDETKDVVVMASFSTNKSFEWKDLNGNGKWDPSKGEHVVDMGVRGLKAFIQ